MSYFSPVERPRLKCVKCREYKELGGGTRIGGVRGKFVCKECKPPR